MAGLTLALLQIDPDDLGAALVFLPMSLIVVANIVICVQLYKRSDTTWRLSTWFYAIQIFSFDANNFPVYLNSGLQLSLSWSIGNGAVSVNFAMMLICMMVYMAWRSVSKHYAN